MLYSAVWHLSIKAQVCDSSALSSEKGAETHYKLERLHMEPAIHRIYRQPQDGDSPSRSDACAKSLSHLWDLAQLETGGQREGEEWPLPKHSRV